jgi:hypothetical protein
MCKLLLKAVGDLIEDSLQSATFQKPLVSVAKYIKPPILAFNAFLSTLITAVVLILEISIIIVTKEEPSDLLIILLGYSIMIILCGILVGIRLSIEAKSNKTKRRRT